MKQPKPQPMKKTVAKVSASGTKNAPDMSAAKSTKARSVAAPSRHSGYESVSVRPIDNGYIVSRSTDKGYSETYSATKPKIEIPACATPKRKA